jgi:hypothetical protein
LLLALPALADNPSRPEGWDATYETWPLDGDAVGQGDDWMRAIKTEIRERLEVEHHFGSANADDVGLHRLGSGRCFFQSAAPTTLEPEGGTTTDHVPTAGGQSGVAALNTDSTAATDNVDGDDEIVGMGRCWIDSDDNSFHIYSNDDGSGSAGWVAVQEGNINLLENGSFEVYDGTDLPDGWTDLLTPSRSVQDTDASNGLGFSFTTTGNGAANEGAQQTLTGLRTSTVYKIQARVDAGAAPDTCSLTTTLAGTNAALTTTTNSWETLVGTFTTDASADVTVQLESDADGDICEWDHVSITELSTPYMPERVADLACTTSAVVADILALTVRTQIPWPKSVLKVDLWVSFQGGGGSPSLRLYQQIDAGADTNIRMAGQTDNQAVERISYQIVNPTVGSEYIFHPEVAAGTPIGPGGTPNNVACIFLEAYPL